MTMQGTIDRTLLGTARFTTFAVAGDFCLAGQDLEREILSRPFKPWSPLQMYFGEQTAIVANLECAMTCVEEGRPFKWANLRMSPTLHGTLDGLAMAVLGNNHIGDFGDQGVDETKKLLAQKGVIFVGCGESLEAALRPGFLDINGRRLGVVSLCCPTTNSEYLATHITPGVAPLGMATLKQSVEGCRAECDALVAFFHWGCEEVHDPAPDQIRLAHYAIDCGADAVVGCHSHTIMGWEKYRGRWIFYGLGNYLFNAGEAQSVREDGKLDKVPLVLRQKNRDSLVVRFKFIPDEGTGRLGVHCIQAMRFGDDWAPKPIGLVDLTFDIATVNARLHAYVAKHKDALRDRCEPEFRATIRNGVLTYYYREESINPPPWRRLRRIVGPPLRVMKGMAKRKR